MTGEVARRIRERLHGEDEEGRRARGLGSTGTVTTRIEVR